MKLVEIEMSSPTTTTLTTTPSQNGYTVGQQQPQTYNNESFSPTYNRSSRHRKNRSRTRSRSRSPLDRGHIIEGHRRNYERAPPHYRRSRNSSPPMPPSPPPGNYYRHPENERSYHRRSPPRRYSSPPRTPTYPYPYHSSGSHHPPPPPGPPAYYEDEFDWTHRAPENNVLAVFGLDQAVTEEILFDFYRKYGTTKTKIIFDKMVMIKTR